MKKRKLKEIKSDDVRLGDRFQKFKVRCSLEMAFYLLIKAHNALEAEIVAENWCRKDKADLNWSLFWDPEATHKHLTFEVVEDT